MTTKPTKRAIAVLALATAAGCASAPTGPSVLVLPAPGKPFATFQAEEVDCRQWAYNQAGGHPGDRQAHGAASGSAIGAMAGAGLGAALGAAAGNAGAGAAIGGGSGLVLGAASGANAGESGANAAQRLYDNAYMQCMYAKGNQIPGVVRQSTPPPPPPVKDREQAPGPSKSPGE